MDAISDDYEWFLELSQKSLELIGLIYYRLPSVGFQLFGSDRAVVALRGREGDWHSYARFCQSFLPIPKVLLRVQP